MTDDKFFSVPVTLSSGGPRMFVIRSVREAAWFLAEKWPRLEGTAFMRALRACAAVLEGKRGSAYARRALLLAAREADLSIVR
ncbi:DUF982 domain-containing protein [Rhizobium sp.]